MKKTIVVFLLLFLFSGIAFAVTGDAVEHFMAGYVNLTLNFAVSVFSDIMPFNLDGADVKYNEAYTTTINGIRIAAYTLISNNYNFDLYITHDKLKLSSEKDDVDTDTNSIDYRLYVVTDKVNNTFQSVRSCANASSPQNVSEDSRIKISGDKTHSYTFVENSMYVSLDAGGLDETVNRLKTLKNGVYESNIFIMLIGGL